MLYQLLANEGENKFHYSYSIVALNYKDCTKEFLISRIFTLVTNLPIGDDIDLDIITLLRLQMHCVLQSESDATDSEGTRSIMNLRK